MQEKAHILSWLHFGDLHMRLAGEQNHRDFAALIEAANTHLAQTIDFAVLPGDNADDGTDEQFQLVASLTRGLKTPLHILPGDHDFKPKTLDGFYRVLGANPLPQSCCVNGHRCLFLDVVSQGAGGPDFRLNAVQLDWLERELIAAHRAQERCVIFMHTYPQDLQEGRGRLTQLLARFQVAFVDMGHTHYNELSNDGHTIFAATRSTGQIEEGDVGFSIASIDAGVVSWVFKPLKASWPLVQITSPADHRLVTDPHSSQQIIRGPFLIRAKIYGGAPITRVTFQFAGCIAGTMAAAEGAAGLWEGAIGKIDGVPDGVCPLTVTATDGAGVQHAETLQVRVARTGELPSNVRHADGSDRDSIGAWPEKHLLGTQLGPNRNGKKW